MKKYVSIAAVLLLILALFAGCKKSQVVPEGDTAPAEPTTEATTEVVTEPTRPESEEDVEYEGDASTYYIDVVYTKQIERYHTALSEKWNESAYFDNGMSALAAYYYEGNPLDNVGFTFMDLDGDGIWELVIGAIANAQEDPLVFEIWALKNDEPVMLVQSGARNRYYLQYSEEENLWSVANEAENGAANHAVYYLQLIDGAFEVTQGIVFDAAANEKAPWFMAYDLDWDVSNDSPIDEDMAKAVMEAGRNRYTAAEYFPYCLY